MYGKLEAMRVGIHTTALFGLNSGAIILSLADGSVYRRCIAYLSIHVQVSDHFD